MIKPFVLRAIIAASRRIAPSFSIRPAQPVDGDSGRGTLATYTASDGVIKYAPHNLIPYSGEIWEAGWTKSQVSAVAGAELTPGGYTAALLTVTTATDPIIARTIPSVNSQRMYSASIWVKGVGASIGKDALLFVARDSYAEAPYATVTLTGAWQKVTKTVTFSADPATVIFRFDPVNSSLVVGDQVLIGECSLVAGEVQPYFPTTATAYHGARIADWSTGSSKPLIEKQATNLCPRSNMAGSGWNLIGGGGTPVSGGLLGGNALNCAIATTGTVGRYYSGAVPSAGTYTCSVYFKVGSTGLLTIGSDAGGSYLARINMATLSITDYIGVGTVGPEIGGWRRFSVTFTRTSGFSPICYINGPADAIVDGYQIEVGTGVTSYIPTAGAAATRGADTILGHTDSLPSGGTFTRGTLATQVNADGTIGWAPHNLCWRNQFSGATVGSPGTLGSEMPALGTTSGITRECVGVGTENGWPYADVRFYGTASAVAAHQIVLGWYHPTYMTASVGKKFTIGAYLRLLAGSLPTTQGLLGLQVTERNNSGAYLAASHTGLQTRVLQGSPTSLQSFTYTCTNATATYIEPSIRMDAQIGQTVDFTLRMYGFQVNLGSTLMGPFPTAGALYHGLRTADYSDGGMTTVRGSELIVNNKFLSWVSDDPVGWTKQFTENASNYVAQVPQGARLVSDGTYTAISQNVLTIGKTYVATITVASVSTGPLLVTSAGFLCGMPAISAPGTYSSTFTASSVTIEIKRQSGALDAVVSAFSIKEVIGHLPVKPGIKIEPQATNLITNNQSTDGYPWLTSSGTLATETSATGLAEYIITAPNDTQPAFVVQSSLIATAGTVLTASVYLKYVNHRYVQLTATSAHFTSPGLAPVVNVDVLSKTIASSLNCTSVKIENVANDFVRVQFTYTVGVSGTGAAFVAGFADSATTTRLGAVTTVGTESFRFFGQQVETGAVATSLIPTYGAATTRATDQWTFLPSAITGWVAGKGAIYTESVGSGSIGGVFGDPSWLELASIRRPTPLIRNSAGNLVSGPSVPSTYSKAALSYGDRSTVSANGVVSTSTVGKPDFSAPTTILRVGHDPVTLSYLTGSLYALDYWPHYFSGHSLKKFTT